MCVLQRQDRLLPARCVMAVVCEGGVERVALDESAGNVVAKEKDTGQCREKVSNVAGDMRRRPASSWSGHIREAPGGKRGRR